MGSDVCGISGTDIVCALIALMFATIQFVMNALTCWSFVVNMLPLKTLGLEILEYKLRWHQISFRMYGALSALCSKGVGLQFGQVCLLTLFQVSKIKFSKHLPVQSLAKLFAEVTSICSHHIVPLAVGHLAEHIWDTNWCTYVAELSKKAWMSFPSSTGMSISVSSSLNSFLSLSPVLTFLVFQHSFRDDDIDGTSPSLSSVTLQPLLINALFRFSFNRRHSVFLQFTESSRKRFALSGFSKRVLRILLWRMLKKVFWKSIFSLKISSLCLSNNIL